MKRSRNRTSQGWEIITVGREQLIQLSVHSAKPVSHNSNLDFQQLNDRSGGVLYRILIAGCGQIGSRHLQAIATLPQVQEVEIFDPQPEALALGRERLAEVSDRAQNIKYRWLLSLDEISSGGDLCIIATQAKGRADLVEQIVACGYHKFILEKLVTQSIADYERLLAFADNENLSVWVNMKSRVHPIWKHVKSRIEPGEPLNFSSIGGNHGLANNGVHMADLFVFFDGIDKIESAGSQIDPILHQSKRGSGVYDLSGTLFGYSGHDSHFTLSFLSSHSNSGLNIVMTSRYRWVVDQMTREAFEGVAEEDWMLRPISFEGDLAISRMTIDFAADILQLGRCELPTLIESFPAHSFILPQLLPIFSQLLDTVDGDRCPVT